VDRRLDHQQARHGLKVGLAVQIGPRALSVARAQAEADAVQAAPRMARLRSGVLASRNQGMKRKFSWTTRGVSPVASARAVRSIASAVAGAEMASGRSSGTPRAKRCVADTALCTWRVAVTTSTRVGLEPRPACRPARAKLRVTPKRCRQRRGLVRDPRRTSPTSSASGMPAQPSRLELAEESGTHHANAAAQSGRRGTGSGFMSDGRAWLEGCTHAPRW
jgi:hypothetical protein